MAERARRRARRRGRSVVVGTAGALVVAGAGTAWAMNTSSGPDYRLASVARADVTQTVEADGTLAAHNRATVAFAAAGTVSAVRVAVGDHVRAGQTLATLNEASLQAAVTSARGTLAQARQRLADDEQAQLTGAAASDDSNGSPSGAATSSKSAPDAAGDVLLTAASSAPTQPKGGSSGGAQSGLRAAQQAVEAAQRALDAAIAQVDADVSAVQVACTSPAGAPQQTTVTAAADGSVSGAVGSATVVTLLDTTTTSVNPQSLAAGQSYRFAGLSAGGTYHLVLVPVVDTSGCTAALATLGNDQSGAMNPASVADAAARLRTALHALDAALAAQSTSSPGTGRHTSTPTAQPTSGNGSAQPSGSGNSSPNGGNGTTVTAAQIAADTAAVDAAQAQLAVAKQAVGEATLTSPISGTVGAVAVTAGQTVAASSSTATISIVGAGTMSVDVDIALAEIDLVKVGETAQVTVDGRSAPFSGHVTYVGGTNTASSTGSSATYAVTVTLDTADARLFDGMGTHVAIVTGVAHDVLSVPISAVHEFGSLTTVDVLRNGRETSTRVTLGVRGDARVEIRSGLAAGDRVVLADMSAAVPSSSSNNSPFGRRSSLGGLSGGGGPVFVGPVGGR